MSQRRSLRLGRAPSPRPPATGDRRRQAVAALAAVVVLLAAAAAIGSRETDDRAADTAARQGSTELPTKASDGASVVPPMVYDSGGDDASQPGAPATTIVGPAGDRASTGSAEASGAGGSKDADGSIRLVGAPADAKIIRTGSLQVQVDDGGFADAAAGLTRIATGLGGFVSASEISSFEDDPRGTITLRVPATQFDESLAEIAKLGKVEALTTASQDVTGEYTDVASRLKALEAERAQIERVLSRAESIPDILSVRDRLSAVQSEIEQHQGRQKVLDDQTSLSTVTVELSEPGSIGTLVRPTPERTGFSELWHDSTERFTDGGRSIALGLATMAPWLLLALVLWLPARWLWRRLAPAAPPAATTTAAA
ncbi:MAG: hypothetical protein JWM47_952 [Acidimicrobiales bacterium]|nr:hypothetical protein [Acidimicrobiales bacterium]